MDDTKFSISVFEFMRLQEHSEEITPTKNPLSHDVVSPGEGRKTEDWPLVTVAQEASRNCVLQKWEGTEDPTEAANQGDGSPRRSQSCPEAGEWPVLGRRVDRGLQNGSPPASIQHQEGPHPRKCLVAVGWDFSSSHRVQLWISGVYFENKWKTWKWESFCDLEG